MTSNVLVVDDGRAMRSLISEISRSLGYHPIPAKSGEEALGLYVEHDIDLVVLDVEMEGIDGFETCRMLRSLSPKKWFPIIYLTASKKEDDIVKGLDAGGDVYITKPINKRVLESTIKAMGRISTMKRDLDDANKELAKLADHDGLTMILNRRGFDRALESAWKQAERENSELCVALLDIDHFKLYNDRYGHLKGDDTLKAIAGALENSVQRPIDNAARYGGEEFALILPKTSREGACHVAKRALENIRQLSIPHESSLVYKNVTSSMGIASNRDCESIKELLGNADKALYQAKNAGRNNYKFWRKKD